MSKERLEEIENKLLQATNEDDEDVVYASICAEAVLEDLQWTVAYAKEQAERVQELEKDIKEWEIVNECWEEINENLAEQNKRYREVINNINEKAMLYGVDEQVYEAIKEAIKALKGESE